jgi:prophage regulatory protein
MTKFLDHADLHARGIKYSKAQLWRLSKAGKFPKPVKLNPSGSSPNNYCEDEVDAWSEARKAARDQAA